MIGYDGIDYLLEKREKKIPNQMEMGIKVEMEHVPTIKKIKAYYERTKKWPKDEEIAKWISQDHLSESNKWSNKNYYTELKKMENNMKSGR